MTRLLALILSAALAAPGCASMQRPRFQSQPLAASQLSTPDQAVLADFARSLPVGTPVRVRLADDWTAKGTLVKVTNDKIVVQPRTRVPEPLIDLPLSRVLTIEIERPSSNLGRSVAIGAAAGAGAAAAVLLILFAIFAND